MSLGDLTESEWRVLKDILPIEAVDRGRDHRPSQNRLTINGILWKLRCGKQWQNVPTKYGNWNTIYLRHLRWSKTGVWEDISVALVEIMADSGHHKIDSAIVCARISAVGGKEGLIDTLLSIRGASSSENFTVWLIPEEDRWPSL